MELPELRSENARGAILSWRIGFDGKLLWIEHGQLSGKKQREELAVIPKCKRTLEEQAKLNAESRWKKMRQKGYAEIGKERDVEGVMLAETYHVGDNLKYPIWGEPKLDGVRALVKKENNEWIFRSREGRIHPALPHLKDKLESMVLPPNSRFDGELYSHGRAFEEIVSMVKNKAHPERTQLEYQIFDITGTDLPYIKRREMIKEPLPGRLVYNADEVQVLFGEITAEGYEGLMLRDPESLYQSRRTRSLLKYKAWLDEDRIVTGVVAGEGREEKCALLVLDGTLTVRPAASFEERARWLAEPALVIGRLYKFKYQALTKKGVPRFPVGIAFCDYESGEREK